MLIISLKCIKKLLAEVFSEQIFSDNKLIDL